MRIMNYLLKCLILVAAITMISIVGTSPLWAQGNSESLLQQIANNTLGILQQVNNLPSYLDSLGKFIISWMTDESSKTSYTTKTAKSFASMGKIITDEMNGQGSVQQQLTADLFGVPVSSFKAAANGQASILKTIPNINDLAYATLLGAPPVPSAAKNANPAYNYVKNAGGMTLSHVAPGVNWQGPVDDQKKYRNYYNTMMAIESFNGFVMSGPYLESQNGGSFNKTQSSLISLASSSSWIGQIATEELGKVLRQILLFESQSYVLLSQLIQTQKQMLSAQVMTNALLILGNQSSETLLVSNAQGVKPQP